MLLKAEWKSVIKDNGALCVMIPGAILMLKLSADSLDIQQTVGHFHYVKDTAVSLLHP